MTRVRQPAGPGSLALGVPPKSVDARRRPLVGVPTAPTPATWPKPTASLRPDGRLLVVHDYGRDDVSRLRGDLPDVRALEPARRAVPLGRVPDPGRPLLLDVRLARSDDGVPPRGVRRGGRERSPPTLKRPRLSYNVAVYHRARGGAAQPTGLTDLPLAGGAPDRRSANVRS